MTSSYYDGQPARSSSVVSPTRRGRSRTQSISSDRPSTIGHNLLAPPQSVSPEAAFIAPSAASQIVTNDHDSHADIWYDEPGMIPTGETALVSPPALQLVNNFLDQLLFNFLQMAKSTTLAALRPAVTEVLKPKLARDAITNADEELREYLGGGDEEDYVQPQNADPSRDWDLELVWKRTRLRCMVYSSLGDMEEEDEDLYMEQEHLEIGADEQISDVISPAVAIFLTSVLEYMGELTLTVAGQASYHRVRTEFEKDIRDGLRTSADIAERIVVEEHDMERVALDRTLGRLWRGWKKRIRTPTIMEFGTRPYSRTSMGHARHESNLTDPHTAKSPTSETGSELRSPREHFAEAAEASQTEEAPQPVPSEPADIPLPLGENDLDEIEVPGLVIHSDDEGDDEDEEAAFVPERPRSILLEPTNAFNVDGSLAQIRSSSIPRSWPIRLSSRSARVMPKSAAPAQEETAAGTAEEAKEEESKDDAEKPVQDVSVEAATSSIEKPTNEQSAAGASEVSDVPGERQVGNIANTSAPISAPEEICSARIVDVAGSGSPLEFEAVPMVEPVEPAEDANTAPKGEVPDYPSPLGAETRYLGSPRTPSPLSPDEVGGTDPFIPARHAARAAPNPEPVQQASSSFAYGIGAATTTQGRVAANTSARAVERPSTIYPNRVSSSPRQAPNVANTKVTILQSSNSGNHYIDEAIPEVPPKTNGHSTRHGSNSNSIGQATMERIRTRESDDSNSLPIQTNAPSRSIHTSGSSGSSAAGRLKALRTSEEQLPSRADSVARNFEELIHSNQTITYTLTPEHMRHMESPRTTEGSGMPRSSSLSGDAKVAAASQRLMGVGATSYDTRGSKPTPISIPATSSKPSTIKSPLRTQASAASSAPRSPAATVTPKSPRMPGSLAREARVPGDSTADFAEFIKSTGPPGETRHPARHSSMGNAPPPVAPAQPIVAAKPSSPSKSSHDPARRVSSASNRNRYQPRDASLDGRGDNSDLIDFIRQGPPSAAGNNRIPRHVAPFRNTMDSEQMVVATAGKAVDASIPEVRHSQASTNATETSGPSLQSSINSNTALLKSKPQSFPRVYDEDGMMPKRKTRRVKDPYAIDFSDEEDDDLATPQPPPKKKEESLAEFLRNYEPPPEPPAPVVSEKAPKKKASAPSLMNRFTRSHKEPKEPVANGLNGRQDSRSLSSRTGGAAAIPRGGHVPIQVHIPPGYDATSSYERSAGQPRVTAASRSSGRVPMKKFEPRDAVSSPGRSGTADLAAFLRDSEPPPSMTTSPVRDVPPEDAGGFSKMFGRRKKGGVY